VKQKQAGPAAAKQKQAGPAAAKQEQAGPAASKQEEAGLAAAEQEEADTVAAAQKPAAADPIVELGEVGSCQAPSLVCAFQSFRPSVRPSVLCLSACVCLHVYV
jgi:hypothetical protein